MMSSVDTVCIGECAVCHETTLQKCRCGRHSELRPCGDDTWSCTEVIHSYGHFRFYFETFLCCKYVSMILSQYHEGFIQFEQNFYYKNMF